MLVHQPIVLASGWHIPLLLTISLLELAVSLSLKGDLLELSGSTNNKSNCTGKGGQRSDGSCRLEGCQVSAGTPDIVSCLDHPDLGLGECPAKDAREIAHRLRKHPKTAKVTDIIRELGTNPVYHNERWARLDANTNQSSWASIASTWQVLHKHGLYFIPDFMSENDADSIVERLKDLPTHFSNIYHGNFLKCEFRKSTTWDITTDYDVLPKSAREEIGSLTNSNLADFEVTQAARYHPGDFYSEHFDDGPCNHLSNGTNVEGLNSDRMHNAFFINSACDDTPRRSGTFLVYLTGSKEGIGGATYFPRLGVRVPAQKGGAIFFRPTHPDGTLDPMLLHAAEGLESGEKYVIQQWIRNPQFR